MTRDRNARTTQRLWVVVRTFRRPTTLARTLASLGAQTHRPDDVVVVDNDASRRTEQIVREFDDEHSDVRTHYVACSENLGSAGATSVGMTLAIDASALDGWLLVLDDDRQLRSHSQLEDLVQISERLAALDPRVGGVGYAGARFDFSSGRLVKPPVDDANRDFAKVDYIAAGHFPLFRMSAIREVGPFERELFFGFAEVEFGLRLRRADFTLYRIDRGRNTRSTSAFSWRVSEPSWRRYYSLRNQVAVLRRYRHNGVAAKVCLRAIAKPVLNMPLHPQVSARVLRQNVRAVVHGWTGRLGKTIDPADSLDDGAELPPT